MTEVAVAAAAVDDYSTWANAVNHFAPSEDPKSA